MPNRIIKESITTSATLAQLSDGEERHFWRLLVQADDFGYLDARPEVIRARAYPLMLDTVSLQESERRTLALVAASLLHLFVHEGKRYGHFPTWLNHQQKRANFSKYPQVESCASNCNPLISDASNSKQLLPLNRDSSIRFETLLKDSRSEKREEPIASPFVLPEGVKQETWDSFLEMRKAARAVPTQHAKELLLKDLAVLKAAGNDPNTVLEQSIKNGWKGLFAIGGNNEKFRPNPAPYKDKPRRIYQLPEGQPILGR